MTRRRSAAAAASLIGAVWGCAANTETESKVTAIVPAAAFNDIAFPALIQGDSFRPTYRFDTMAAAAGTDVGTFTAALTPVGGAADAAIALEGVTWQSPWALAVTVPAGVPAGRYDVGVTDPRGRKMQLEKGFVSLGSDTVPPAVHVDAPAAGAIIGSGTTVQVTLAGDDGDGVLATLGASIATTTMTIADVACNIPSGAHATSCHASFVAPAPVDENDVIIITPYATDSVGLEADTTPATFTLAARPSLIGATPTVGPASGGTEIVVRGSDFIEGTVLLFGSQIVPPTSVTATEIRALTPAHDPGTSTLKVATGGSPCVETMYFDFIPAPIVRLVKPPHGPVTGGTHISVAGNYFRGIKTHIEVGGRALLCQTFMGANRIDGVVPPAADGDGPVVVTAWDEIGGTATVADDVTFTYDPGDGDPPDLSCGGGP
jgi:hypothetical protein